MPRRPFGKPIELREFPLPTELGPGDLLIKITLAGVCGTDVHLHQRQLDVPLPLIMGHETVGVVAEMRGACDDFN